MPEIIISCFFSGTSFSYNDRNELAGLLYKHINTDKEGQVAIGFNGCARNYGKFRGGIFGAGLDVQCLEVIARVQAEIKSGNTVKLNIFGHSRGGIAALMLAKQLSN